MEEVILKAVGLRKSFGGVRALDGVDLEVRRGEYLAIVGPNGSGKTTLINALTGFIRLDSGKILFLGREITNLPPQRRLRLGIARSFQLPSAFWGLTVYENVAIAVAAAKGISLRRVEEREVRETLELFGLWEKRMYSLEKLSEGEKKLLDVALAAVSRPKLMLLDEPTSSVAADDKYRIMDSLAGSLKSLGASAVFVEHDLDIVKKYASRVLVMAQGRVVAVARPEDADRVEV